jgi:hypothetical protein
LPSPSGCAEQFYEEEATRELKAMHSTAEQRRDMARTLRRFETESGMPPGAGDPAGISAGGGIASSDGEESGGVRTSSGDESGGEEEAELDDAQREALVQMLSALDASGGRGVGTGGLALGGTAACAEGRGREAGGGACGGGDGGDDAGGGEALSLDESLLLSASGRARFRRLVADGSLAQAMQAQPCW